MEEEICDLGATLEPRLVDAVAYDSAGIELGRALAAPEPATAARPGRDPRPGSGQQTGDRSPAANGIASEEPESIVLFDGVRRAPRIPTPSSCRATTPSGSTTCGSGTLGRWAHVVVERTFGGSFVDEVDTELTAVALQLDKGAAEPRPDVQGWLRARGEGIAVVDVVSGARILLVATTSASATSTEWRDARPRAFERSRA